MKSTLEDREQIRELVARYGFDVDARDIEAIADCLTETASVASTDGVHRSVGRDQVVAQYHDRFSVLGPSNHFTHDHTIRFDERDRDRAFGAVNAHAELVRNGRAMLAALRYEDEYRRGADGRWRFERRLLAYFYYLEPGEYPRLLGEPMRMRAYERPLPADFPDGLESYRDCYERRSRGA